MGRGGAPRSKVKRARRRRVGGELLRENTACRLKRTICYEHMRLRERGERCVRGGERGGEGGEGLLTVL